jgi:hypothetical protein
LPPFLFEQVVTLMSNDAQKVQEVILGIHVLWGAPALIIVILFLLYQQVPLNASQRRSIRGLGASSVAGRLRAHLAGALRHQALCV